jgi:hypothetical protein
MPDFQICVNAWRFPSDQTLRSTHCIRRIAIMAVATSKSSDETILKGKGPNFGSFWLAAAALLPGIIAGLILYTQRLLVPYQDDYNAILNFAVQYKHASGFSAKALQIALFQHNSYRMIFEHLIVAAQIQSIHHLNFGFLATLGDLFLIGIFALLWYSFEGMPFRKKLLYFLPVSFMFFSLCYWETLNWAEADLQNVPVIFFALWSLYLLDETDASDSPLSRFLLSCFAALVCCATSANGFLLAPVGILMLSSQRRFKYAFFWMFSFVPPLLAYLGHTIVLFPPVPGHYFEKLFLFIAFLGGALWWHPLAFIVGLALLGALAWTARAHFGQPNSVLFFFALWIVLTSALVESTRMSTASRYSMYSVLMIICSYNFVLRGLNQQSLTHKPRVVGHLQSRRFLQVALAFSICFYMATAVWAYRHLAARREMVLRGMRYYLANPVKNSPQINPGVDAFYPPETPLELRSLNQAVHEGLYTVPPETDLDK